MRLPERFTKSMTSLLKEESSEFFKSYEGSARSGLRVNTSKIDISRFENLAPYSIEKIPFTANGYYINDTDAWSKHPYYYAGLYYLQEPSAMLPASLLPVNEGDIVLDLCAAPGGKSTELLLRHPGLLISNDISHARTIPLVKNLEHWGGDFAVTCMDPKDLAANFPECFDSILVDAPCSGEGMFRKDRSLISSYEDRGPEYYAPIQAEILENAYSMLKWGGMLCYSTCTFSDTEDEQVIASFLEKHRDMSMSEIKKDYGLTGCYDKYKDHPELEGCVHAFPHRFKGEGHFVALMKKNEGENKRLNSGGDSDTCGFSDLPECVKEFATTFSDELYERFFSSRFIIGKDGQIFLLPSLFPELLRRNIRYSRTGICVGSIKRSGKFMPHTAFAMNIGYRDMKNSVSFAADDINIIKYLKGETVNIQKQDMNKGFVLVCVDSFSLGFAVYDGNKLKNLYEKGWTYK